MFKKEAEDINKHFSREDIHKVKKHMKRCAISLIMEMQIKTTRYSCKKEWIWVSCCEVNELRACYTKWSKSGREKQISYINTYIWNLEKWYWWTYLQGRNGDADVENRLVDTSVEEEGGTNWETSIDTYTLLHVQQITSWKLLYNTGSPAWWCLKT